MRWLKPSKHRDKPKLLSAAFSLFCAAIAMVSGSAFPANDLPEYSVKAAFLLNIPDFVLWPEAGGNRRQSKRICVYGDNPFENYLQQLIETKSDDSIELTYLETLTNVVGCHLLFISQSEKNSVDNIIKILGNDPILTVSDIGEFARKQGMIEFNVRDNKIRMLINLNNTANAQLKLDSNLIELSTIVN